MKKSYNIISALVICLMGVGLSASNNTNIKSDNKLIVRNVLRANESNNSGEIVKELNEAPVEGNKISEVYAQTTTPKEGKVNIRFVAGIDTYTYDYAAFNITLKDDQKNTIKTVTYEVTSAYHSIAAGETIKKANEVFGEGYNYLIAYTITDVPKDYWNYYYDVTASIGSDSEHVTTSATSNLKNIVKNSDVILDGEMNDPIWTDEVKAKPFKLYSNHEAHLTQIDLYATRNSKGIYFYADYSSKVSGKNNTDWWKGDNLEFRLYSPSGMLRNSKQVSLNRDINQFWISYFNGKHDSNLSNQFVKEAKLNSETNRYETSFEFFISYDLMEVTPNTPIAFTMGTNPIGNYWFNANTWDTNFTTCSKVTNDGIDQYLDIDECITHKYYSEHTTPVSCKNDGLDTYTCEYCKHSYTEVVKATGDHNFSIETARTPSNCHTHGVVTYKCTGCDITKDVSLELDPFAHTNISQGGKWLCCEKLGYDRYNAGGWEHEWTPVIDNLTGNFEVTATIAMETKVHHAESYFEGILPILQHQLEDTTKRGSIWVSRFDWWGWCDQWDSSEKLTTSFNNMDESVGNRDVWWTNSDGNNVQHDDFISGMEKSILVWKITRNGKEVINHFTIKASTGKVYTYWTKATDVSEEKTIRAYIGSEYAKFALLDVTKK